MASFPTHQPLASGVLGRILKKESMCNSVVASLFLPAPMPDQVHMYLGHHCWAHLPKYESMPHTVVELGAKSKLSPRACDTKEEELKSLLAAI